MPGKHQNLEHADEIEIIHTCQHGYYITGHDNGHWLWRCESIHNKHLFNEPLDRNVYWNDEYPVYDADKLNAINERFAIDTVITHTGVLRDKMIFRKNGYNSKNSGMIKYK